MYNSNNPFISDPTNAQSRFPDLTAPSPPVNTQYTQWLQSPPSQLQFHPAYPISQQPAGTPFQPSSSFGQQLAANISGSSYGYLQPQQQQQQQYNPVQQQLQSPTYVAQFDPYSSIGQGWDGQSPPPQNTGPYSTSQISPSSTSPSGDPHPRDYIRTHKVELEAWDGHAWKQLLDAFDALKNAWDSRTKDLGSQVAQLQQQLAYSGGGYYAGQIQQEGTRLQGLFIEAQSNFDSVTASVFQMREVYQGYRQSGDLSSKRRVREACNAALQGLADWPPNAY